MADTFIFKISEDQYQGDAQFAIKLDGVQYSGVFMTTAIRSAGQVQDFSFSGNFSSVHQISVTFLNDLYLYTNDDRNLYVNSFNFNGVTTPGSSPTYTTGAPTFGDKTGLYATNDVAAFNVNGNTGTDLIRHLIATYRFYDTATNDHFYTQSVDEKNYVLKTQPTYKYEGVAFATPDKAIDTIDVFRFFDTATKNHFYTGAGERDIILKTQPTYIYEGVSFQAYADLKTAGPGGETLERFYNTDKNVHHYAPAGEAYNINHGSAGPGWIDEGPSLNVHIPTGEMLNM